MSVGAALAGAIVLAAATEAQQGTVLVTNGERVVGRVSDMDKNGFTVDVGGQERRIMKPEVVMIDFTGTSRNPTRDELNRIREGREVVVLKNGTILTGEVVDYERTMGGALKDLPASHAFRVRFQPAGGGEERTFLSSEVARFYFKDPSSLTTGGGGGAPAQPGAMTIEVPANRPWTPTNLTVRQGETLRFESSGRIQLTLAEDDVAEPAGSLKGRYAPAPPLPRSLAGALIGRIGTNGRPFGIGNQTSVPMPAAGQLFLGINDDGFDDNSGEFTVVIRRSFQRR
ncbi:MAG TPA: hypothetical protein VLD67_04510 [Vicinamibacterales bacterium]|nr:hypothetical protein [Vicinamibacterales bacterium]